MTRVALCVVLAFLDAVAEMPTSKRIYIEPRDGFDSYISAAMVKKQVPIVVTKNREDADYIITSKVIEKEESTGSKIARCAFAYCAGIGGAQTATVELVEVKTNSVAWAYNVKKAGSHNYQSSAEAIAKHLKVWLARK